MSNSLHIKEFSRYAKSYISYNDIQKEVANELCGKIVKKEFKSILDLGCGNGLVYDIVKDSCKEFVAIDSSLDMLLLHPIDDKTILINSDFEKDWLFEKKYDLIIASSSLHWSNNIEKVIKNIQTNSLSCCFSIYTDQTFKEIQEVTKKPSILPSKNSLLRLFEKYFSDFKYEIKSYKKDFQDPKFVFEYIKKCGISGGKKRLGFKETKDMINGYKKRYLSFEVLFFWHNL